MQIELHANLIFSTTVKMLDYKAMVPGYETPIDVDLKDHIISKIIGKYLIQINFPSFDGTKDATKELNKNGYVCHCGTVDTCNAKDFRYAKGIRELWNVNLIKQNTNMYSTSLMESIRKEKEKNEDILSDFIEEEKEQLRGG